MKESCPAPLKKATDFYIVILPANNDFRYAILKMPIKNQRNKNRLLAGPRFTQFPFIFTLFTHFQIKHRTPIKECGVVAFNTINKILLIQKLIYFLYVGRKNNFCSSVACTALNGIIRLNRVKLTFPGSCYPVRIEPKVVGEDTND